MKGLGLQLEVVGGGDLPRGEQIYAFDGAPYTVAEATADWLAIGRAAFQRDAHAAPYPSCGTTSRRRGGAWTASASRMARRGGDRDLVEVRAPAHGRQRVGVRGRSQDQSSLNLIGLLGLGRALQLVDYDENFHVVGGNDQIVSRMVHGCRRTVRRGHVLVALTRRAAGDYRLTFDVDGAHQDVIADHVVLALPFSTLRDVDLTGAGFTARKSRRSAPWGWGRTRRSTWSCRARPGRRWATAAPATPTGRAIAWPGTIGATRSARRARHPAGLPRRPRGARHAHRRGPRPGARARRALVPRSDRAGLPRHARRYTGRAYEDHWSVDPWHKGAYSYYRVGQFTSFAGIEHLQQGLVYFAGEHTDVAQQGFLDGAVASGTRAADEIRAQV